MKKIISTITLSTVILVSCGKDQKEVVQTETPITVVVGSITENTNQPFVTASGVVEAENSANLSTRMMGYVTKIHVKVGQKVQQGQLLVSVNNTDLQAKKAQVEASILQAQAGFNNAQKDYNRFVNLFAQQSASQKELDDMTARFEMAKASLEAAKQMKSEIMAQFAYVNITAPFSGIVTHTFLKEGDMANPGVPLISIEGTSNYQVTARVSENEIAKIVNGMQVKVLLKSKNAEFKGRVSEVSSSSKNTGGQFLVKINVEPSEVKLLPGMYTTVQFPLERAEDEVSDKILIPTEIIMTKGDLKGIYTVSQQNTAMLRWIRLGRTFGNQTEVLSGFNANEKYIISSQGRLYNGVSVQY